MRDADVRTSLRKQLASEHAGDANTLIVEELGLCQNDARIDIAVVNGELSGFEIKSDRDTLGRLPRQIEVYGRVCDRVTIVCGQSHLLRVRDVVPRWWGIVVARKEADEVVLHDLRSAKLNRRLDMGAMIQLVWKNEAQAILAAEGVRFASRWSTYDLWVAAVSGIDRDRLAFLIRETIKARGNWRSGSRQIGCDGSRRPVAKSLHSQAPRILQRIRQ